MKRKYEKNEGGRYLLSGLLAIASFVATKRIVQRINRYSVEDRVILITGGSRGLGLIMARRLAAEGAKLVICGRDENDLAAVTEELSSAASQFLALQCDITQKDQVDRMINEINLKMGPVDILINNAGTIEVGPAETMKENDYETALKTHFWGPYYVINAVLPQMKDRKEGRIVNIASIGGIVSFPHLLPYNVSKFALSGFSKGIAAELAKDNIKVTTIYPGLMRTGSPRNIDVKGQHKKEYAWFKLSDANPVISISAERAARKIINAMKSGDKTLILSLPAKLGNIAEALAPGAMISIFNLVNQALPDYPGNGSRKKKGYESNTKKATTKRAEKAEKKYNQRAKPADQESSGKAGDQ